MNFYVRAFVLTLLFSCTLNANPYPDPSKVPSDVASLGRGTHRLERLSESQIFGEADEALRVDIKWNENEKYELISSRIEHSGTPALWKRSRRHDPLGSYEGVLTDRDTGKPVAYASVGTGMEYRKLVRDITFRFPVQNRPVKFHLIVENPDTAVMEEVFVTDVNPKLVEPPTLEGLEVRSLKKAEQAPPLMVNVYADGYSDDGKDQFWKDAQKVVTVLQKEKFPFFNRMEFKAVFAPSKDSIGQPTDLGLPIPERDTFLGLYYPYWDNFGRWYNVVYATREVKFRDGIGRVPYDYPIVLIDNDVYFGVGNFNELTAIPARNSKFSYLLMHEFGHFFGLNEEYEGGGRTELSFSPAIQEPWSQNITFLRSGVPLKWKAFVEEDTPIPTPNSYWRSHRAYGAYEGGYAQSEPQGQSHKPGLGCVMNTGSAFCPVCKHALEEKITFDLGE